MAASEIEKLERMVRENPKGRLFASLADAYRKDAQYPKALEVLEAGLVNHPDYVSARVVLGRVYLATGDRAKAREAFARVVQLDPESVIALKALADLAEEEGQGEEALRWSGQLLTVDPGNDEALKQQERLAAAATPASAPLPIAEPPADATPEVRLSGIVPMLDEEPAAPAPASDADKTAAPFEAVKPPVLKTKEIPAIQVSNAPVFAATPEPLDQPPEPLPLMPISEEAQTEQVASTVTPMAALEPTSFDAGTEAPTERLAGLDPTGMTEDEVAAISAAPGFEPNSDTTAADIPAPRSSLLGLETMSGELVEEAQSLPEPEAELEREQEIEISTSGSNEFQEDSAAETLQRRSGANEFQVASDADTLDAGSARASEAIETGGSDLAFIEPGPEVTPAYAPPPETPEPAVTEPEPVVTESMAELYAAQGHLADALDVYRQLALRDPGESRFQERIVELEMYVGGGMPAAPAPIPVVAQAPVSVVPPAPIGAAGTGETVGAWLATVFAETLPGTTPAAEPAELAVIPMVEEEPTMAPPAPMTEEAPPVEAPVPTEAIPQMEAPAEPEPEAAPPLGAPTRPASGSFSLSNVFEEPTPAASGSFDDFFGAPASAAPAPAPKAPGTPGTRSTRPASAQPPSDDDVASFQDWLKGLKK
ncbi:MAG TPA: tetratricopeptide repeat protein [Gemmatimonadales bacterium]|nr:tetratricopeptide repeat protein [Gemmatimonadales bacterium]